MTATCDGRASVLVGTAGAYDGVQAGHLIWKPLSRPLLVASLQACKRLFMLFMFRGARTHFALVFISFLWALGMLYRELGWECRSSA